MRITKLMTVFGSGQVNLDAMTLEQAMLYLCDVAYWPMTESSGNALDHKNDYDIGWDADVVRANYAIPNGGSIPTFNGLAEGSILAGVFSAFGTAFPLNKGSIICIAQVADVAAWETLDGAARYLFNFRTDTNKIISAYKGQGITVNGSRVSNSYFDIGGSTLPALIGLTWDTATGLLYFYTNGERGVVSVASQTAYDGTLSSTYTRIGADTSFGTNKWRGAIGHFGISNKVLTGAQFKSIFRKFYPAARKFFIIGDSKSTGANFWPGYLQNTIYAATTDYWTDGPRRYAQGGYDISAMKTFVNANLSAETETPEVILINMGTNDARAVTITAEAIFKADYNAVIAACQAKWPGVPIYCQHIYRADSAQCITNSGIINGYIDDIVASYGSGVYAGPADDVYIENGEAGATYLSADLVHYSIAGHSQVAAQWYAILDAAGVFA